MMVPDPKDPVCCQAPDCTSGNTSVPVPVYATFTGNQTPSPKMQTPAPPLGPTPSPGTGPTPSPGTGPTPKPLPKGIVLPFLLGGGGGGKLFTCPYPLKIQACPPQDNRHGTRSKVLGKEILCSCLSFI